MNDRKLNRVENISLIISLVVFLFGQYARSFCSHFSFILPFSPLNYYIPRFLFTESLQDKPDFLGFVSILILLDLLFFIVMFIVLIGRELKEHKHVKNITTKVTGLWNSTRKLTRRVSKAGKVNPAVSTRMRKSSRARRSFVVVKAMERLVLPQRFMREGAVQPLTDRDVALEEIEASSLSGSSPTASEKASRTKVKFFKNKCEKLTISHLIILITTTIITSLQC